MCLAFLQTSAPSVAQLLHAQLDKACSQEALPAAVRSCGGTGSRLTPLTPAERDTGTPGSSEERAEEAPAEAFLARMTAVHSLQQQLLKRQQQRRQQALALAHERYGQLQAALLADRQVAAARLASMRAQLQQAAASAAVSQQGLQAAETSPGGSGPAASDSLCAALQLHDAPAVPRAMLSDQPAAPCISLPLDSADADQELDAQEAGSRESSQPHEPPPSHKVQPQPQAYGAAQTQAGAQPPAEQAAGLAAAAASADQPQLSLPGEISFRPLSAAAGTLPAAAPMQLPPADLLLRQLTQHPKHLPPSEDGEGSPLQLGEDASKPVAEARAWQSLSPAPLHNESSPA